MLKETAHLLRRAGLTGPGLVMDPARARANLTRMTERADTANAAFRPHFKTHQSGVVGGWFADAGIDRIAVSSLAMAEYFAEFGWRDITLAVLLDPNQLPRIGELAAFLAARGGRLGLTVDSAAAAARLADEPALPVVAWIKIDTGYGRTGLPWDRPAELAAVLASLGPVPAAGLLTHAGQSYQTPGPDALQALWTQTTQRLQAARDAGGRPELLLSSGDTPCCSAAADLRGVDELRPGNFIFYDLMQLELGACGPGDLALAAVCPVIGLYPERATVVVHGGAVHLAKERLERAAGPVYGCLGTVAGGEALHLDRVLTELPLTALSQEHGIIELDRERWNACCGRLVVGDPLLIWPVHSCLTADLHREYRTLDGQTLPRR